MKRMLVVALLFGLLTSTLAAQQHPSQGELRDAGFQALQRGDRPAAVEAADALVADFPNDAVAWRLAGDLYLRAGEIPKALTQFKRYIARVPKHEPELWQHGIALALTGEYEAGKELFELHRTANPHDVENALWHFYCVAKASTPQQARGIILPAPGDRRVPMEQLLRLYRGEGDEAAVRAAVDELPPQSSQLTSAAFYADLYLAMHADAEGDRQRALELAEQAAAAKEVNYMTDVGRVYHGLLRDAAP